MFSIYVLKLRSERLLMVTVQVAEPGFELSLTLASRGRPDEKYFKLFFYFARNETGP